MLGAITAPVPTSSTIISGPYLASAMTSLCKYLSPVSHRQLSKSLLLYLNPIHRSTMSTATPKHEWLCILPDVEGAREKRLAVRPLHFAGVEALVADGFLTWGGTY